MRAEPPLSGAHQRPAPVRRGTKQTGVRLYNERLVLSLVRQHGALPRASIARLTGLSPPTVSEIVGQLEWQATLAARELLRVRDAMPVRIADLILGPDLGQCCGGRVELWLERLTRNDLPWLSEAARSVLPPGGRADAPKPPYVVVTEFSGGVASHRLQRSPPGAANRAGRRAPRP